MTSRLRTSPTTIGAQRQSPLRKAARAAKWMGVSGTFFWAYNGYEFAAVKVCPLRSFFLQ